MIDFFTKQQFEDALPKLPDGRPLWRVNGYVGDEWCYVIPVKPGVMIFVRSTVGPTCACKASGEDSIRCWLVNEKPQPLGSKNERWISRVNGWRDRITKTLRVLWRVGRKLTLCPRCAVMCGALKVKKAGPSKGRFFAKCPECGEFVGWLTPPETSTSSTAS